MADEGRIDIGIYYHLHPDEVSSGHAKMIRSMTDDTARFEKKVRDLGMNSATAYGGMSTAGVSAHKKIADSASQAGKAIGEGFKVASIHLKTYSELEASYRNKSTAELRTSIAERIRLIGDEKAKRNEAILNGDKTEAASHRRRLIEYQTEQTALRSLFAQREEVAKKGFGAIVGQLGIGRELEGIGGNSLGMLGGLAAAAGGIYGITHELKDFAEAGMHAAQIQQLLTLAYKSAGVPIADMNRELRKTNEFAEEYSRRWNVDSERIRQLSGFIAQIGNISGDSNRNITKLSVGVEELTSQFGTGAVTAEQFAKILSRDPESEPFIGRLRLSLPDLADKLKAAANTEDEVRIASQYLAPKLKELDERANTNEQAVKKAGVAWGEVKRQIGIDFIDAAGGALSATSALSNGVEGHTKLLAALTIAVGSLTAAFALLVIAKKIAHDQEVIELVASGKSIVAHFLHAEAIATETGATYAWAAAMRAALPTLGLITGGLAAVAYSFIFASERAKVLDVALGDLEERGKRASVEKGKAAEDDKKAGESATQYKNVLISLMGPMALLIDAFRSDSTAKDNDTRSTTTLTRALGDAAAEIAAFRQGLDNTRTQAESLVTNIVRDQITMKNGWIDAHGVRHQLSEQEQAIYSRSIKNAESAASWRAKELNQYNALNDAESKRLGLTEADKPQKEKKGPKAQSFDSQIKDFSSFIKDLHELHLLSDQEEINSLNDQMIRVRQMKGLDYVERIRAEAEIQTRLNEIKKKGDEESLKQSKEDLTLAKEAYNEVLQNRIAIFEEEAATGKKVDREILVEKIATAKAILAVATFQNEGIAEAEKALNELRHALRVLDLKDETDQAKKKIDIQNQIEDKHNSLIKDKVKRETAQEESRHDRELRKIADEVANERQRNELIELERLTHAEAMARIENDSQSELTKILSNSATAGFGVLNKSIETNIDLLIKDQGVLGTFAKTFFKDALLFGGKKLMGALEGAFAPHQAQKPKAPGSPDDISPFGIASFVSKGGQLNEWSAKQGSGQYEPLISSVDSLKISIDNLAAKIAGPAPGSKSMASVGTGGGPLQQFASGGVIQPDPNNTTSDGGVIIIGHPGERVINPNNVKTSLPLGSDDDRDQMHSAMRVGMANMLAQQTKDKGIRRRYKKLQTDTLSDLDTSDIKHDRESAQLDKQNESGYADIKAGLGDRSALDQALHDFFASKNDEINRAATSILVAVKDGSTPLIGAGYGMANTMAKPALGLTDLAFGTNSLGAMSNARQQIITGGGFNSTAFGVGEVGGDIAGLMTNHATVTGMLGSAGALGGAQTGAIQGVPKLLGMKQGLEDGNGSEVGRAFVEYIQGIAIASLTGAAGEKLHHAAHAGSLLGTTLGRAPHTVAALAEHGIESATEGGVESANASEPTAMDPGEDSPSHSIDKKGQDQVEAKSSKAAQASKAMATGIDAVSKSMQIANSHATGLQKGLGIASTALGALGSLIPGGGIIASLLPMLGGLKNGGIPHWSTGHLDLAGIVHGPGSDTSDSVLAAISNREGVMSAKGVRGIGADLFHGMNSGAITRDHLMRGLMPDKRPVVSANEPAHLQQHFQLSMAPVTSAIEGLRQDNQRLVSEMQAVQSAIRNIQITGDASGIRAAMIGSEGYDGRHTM